MKYDIIVTGVGGQGVLSIAAVIATAALENKLYVKQSEVHGMAQRGGAVFAHLRLGSEPVASDLVSRGCASMILSLEPLESLRYLEYLGPDGWLVTSTSPTENMAAYPQLPVLLERIRSLPHAVLIDAEELARKERNLQGVNMVMVGAASNWLPLDPDSLVRCIERRFAARGEAVVRSNLKLFDAGREAARAGQPVAGR
jgi:indolepyruvate ferredoxin oxidoreductase beta subunit